MMKKALFLILAVISLVGCEGQTEKFSLQDVKFQSIFGTNAKNPKQVFCLQGTGFFRADRSENADSMINNWISEHPNAEIIPVSSTDEMTYCWVVDKTDNLNVFLIKNGCFPGGTMVRPQTYKEMSPEMKSVYPKNYNLLVHIEKSKYDAFIQQIKQAEISAKKERLGIWSKEDEEE